jgi:hypothetical protein
VKPKKNPGVFQSGASIPESPGRSPFSPTIAPFRRPCWQDKIRTQQGNAPLFPKPAPPDGAAQTFTGDGAATCNSPGASA